ncbi:PorV/PorQ family protein [bacterium]|nr:PorV/PorQ family protein [bacterium]MBU1071669.1 PorV/PorQ family protein [bacterium]MBU1676743.1 PorV/PorQ family protein [bacterium]
MSRKSLLFMALFAAGLLSAGSSVYAISGAGAIALEFPIGARYNALGEAGTALSQDATAMWWNPGGLAFATDVHSGRIHAMQSKLVPDLADDIAIYWGGYVGRKWGGSLGFNLTYLSMGEQLATSDDGTPGENFTSNMWAAGVVYGTRLSPNLGFGIGFKFFRDNLAPDNVLQDKQGGSGSTFAVDAGVLWKVPSLKSNFAVAISNLGPNITHVDADQSDPLPRKITFGAARSLMHSEATSLLFVADMLVPLLSWDDAADDYGLGLDFGEKEWGVGLEWSYVQSLFIRLGYKKGTGQIEDMTWGLGMHMGRWVGQNITFGFASVPQAKGLKNVNRFSIGYDF